MSGYIGSTPVPQATQHRESFTATSGQTTFATAGYTAGFVDVYLNGSHLSPADFVATNGSDVVLVSGCGADDVCDIISHSAFEINAQVFTGDFTVDGTTLVVDSTNNRVGIGTSSPTIPLHIDGGSSSNILQLSNTATGSTGSDGVVLGMSSSDVYFFNRENTALRFGTNNTERMRIAATGAVTMPLQPAFEVKPAGAQNNIAVGSNVVVVFGTELMDIGGNFASNTFTAPVAGVYQFNVIIQAAVLDSASTYYEARLNTTNEIIDMTFDPDFGQDAAFWTFSGSVTVPLDASDTANVLFVQASGTQQTDIRTQSRFSGFLAC